MPVLSVVVGVIVAKNQHVLLAKRPAHKSLAGLWEFPGGKVEAGEQPYQALCRELDEEVGIQVQQAKPLLQFQHTYTDRVVDLDVWLVDTFVGDAFGREGQLIRWVMPSELDSYDVPDANKAIIEALKAQVIS
jgi:8-oxo-dGTP diphosphatase